MYKLNGSLKLETTLTPNGGLIGWNNLIVRIISPDGQSHIYQKDDVGVTVVEPTETTYGSITVTKLMDMAGTWEFSILQGTTASHDIINTRSFVVRENFTSPVRRIRDHRWVNVGTPV